MPFKIFNFLGFTLLSILVSAQGFCQNLDSLFMEIRNNNADYFQWGTVCEQVARVELGRKYPKDQYKIATNIVYSQNNVFLGELDIVIFKREKKQSKHKAIMIGEVKCTTQYEAQHEKAVGQLERIHSYLKRGDPVEFHLASDRRVHFSRSQFDEVSDYVTISPAGGEEYFDLTLENTHKELMDLRQRIMDWQVVSPLLRDSN